MDSVRLNNVTIYYHWKPAAADKPTLIFINSLGTDLRIWDAVSSGLGARVSILTYDKRGHGLSDLGDVPYTIDNHVDDLEGLFDHLGPGPSVVCGLSVGGLIALGLAARRPELVKSLVLCDTAPKIGTAQSWNERIDAVTRNGIGSIADMVLGRWFTPAFRSEETPTFAIARNMLLRQPVEGYAATCAAIRDADFTAVAASLRVPALCIVGAEDGATPPELVEAMARIIPDSRFHIIGGCGHIPCVERPDEIIALLAGFIFGTVTGDSDV